MEAKTPRVQLERRVDSCWSWVVCFSSFIVQFLILGTHNSFGSFFVALLQEFQRSEAETGKKIYRIIFPQTGWLTNKKFIAVTGYVEKTLANFVATRNFRSVFVAVIMFCAGRRKLRQIKARNNFAAAFPLREKIFFVHTVCYITTLAYISRAGNRTVRCKQLF